MAELVLLKRRDHPPRQRHLKVMTTVLFQRKMVDCDSPIVIQFGNPEQTEGREERLWEFWRTLSYQHAMLIAWISDSSGTLQVGLKDGETYKPMFLQAVAEAWAKQCEYHIVFYPGDGNTNEEMFSMHTTEKEEGCIYFRIYQ